MIIIIIIIMIIGTSDSIVRMAKGVSEINCRGDELDISECKTKLKKVSQLNQGAFYSSGNDEGSGAVSSHSELALQSEDDENYVDTIGSGSSTEQEEYEPLKVAAVSCQGMFVITSTNNQHNIFFLFAYNIAELLCKYGDTKYTRSSILGSNVLDAVVVEFCYNGSWKVAYDRNWTNQGASVLCRTAGYTPQGQCTVTMMILKQTNVCE